MVNREITIRYELITPQRARELLKEVPDYQRTIRRKVVARYAEDMATGHWNQNPDFIDNPIVIATTGAVLNGQHRLRAIELANIPVYMPVQYGVNAENYSFYDNNLKRTAGDQLNVKNANVVAAIATMIIAAERGNRGIGGILSGEKTSSARVSRAEVIEYAEEHEELLQRCATNGERLRRGVGGSGATVGGFASYLVIAFGDDDRLDDYCVAMSQKESTDPLILAIRQQVMRGVIEKKMGREKRLGIFLGGYEYWTAGAVVSSIRMPERFVNKYMKKIVNFRNEGE